MADRTFSKIVYILWIVINFHTVPVLSNVISSTRLFSVVLHAQTATWNNATHICAHDGGRLAILDTPYKNTMVLRFVKPYFYAESARRSGGGRDYGAIWIGYYFKPMDGEHKRHAACSSQPVSPWTDWTPNSNEPNGIEDFSQCVRLTIAKSHWQTYHCNFVREFICEYSEAEQCSFDNSPLIAINTSSPSILTAVTQYAVSEAEGCRDECLKRTSGDKECWAASETIVGAATRECMLFFAVDHATLENELMAITQEEQAARPVLQIKSCFKSTFDNTTSDVSMYKKEQRPTPFCNMTTIHLVGTSNSILVPETEIALIERDGEVVENNTRKTPVSMCSPCPPCKRLTYRTQAEQIKIDQETEAMIEKLKVNKSQISATRRRYTSANDNRPVARYVGGIAVVLLCLIAAGIASFDVSRLIRDLSRLMANVNLLFRK